MRGAKRSAAEAAMSSITPGAPNSDDDVESSMMADSDNDDNDDPIPITQTSEVLSQSQRSMSLSQSSVMTLSQPSQSQGPGVEGGAASGEGGAPSAKRAKLEQLDEVPLVVSAAVCKDNKASLLVHLRDETLNFSGDTGAIGRMAVHSKKSKGSKLTFDLKGQQFDGQIIPSATVLVVGVGRTEAKVEGLFSEVCRLSYKGNVLDAMGGQVLKGEMDASYRFEDEDVNARGGPAGVEGDGGGEDDTTGGSKGKGSSSAKTPKSGRKKSGSSGTKSTGKSSSAKKGGGKARANK